ncbi:hypothetical protein A3H80_03450 [Candidatus Roizmanbacteria bacterium RIFCSPLOWO2_02_FULL_37_19]|uniref:Uncharacterized protein n=1 Tax=Candidatus Roizmanbacteria bacterium RIFCSPHIGHO2_02_FULL_37_24 TaxID=1802037 RepID=A0A1F7GVY6_9BACT|nr:MAG: hypothetical protein A2862_03460 [Candidatus Roizmanbacteria bacterium RIFCSPHIGHO2_01_FULL_38_41]OGK23071.1 MAG: hypothetical protein A3C24_01565 [Candidatus Roizmanbacteria bacterium RIFCSPHIGHO2_02_FULL_37_24]OGK54683.1 MAG: hypothetical protein A3H80_03450 [Candidatus Roizmanbacteria bacterium RIFCSPLOWO2_02_FULL_37_19]OGK61730.1 MAG: hypothetical protein A3G65_02310 [Candidatus Roizmanbacteria bacterium RIFCSPLOWO2_12_FULL_37_7b]
MKNRNKTIFSDKNLLIIISIVFVVLIANITKIFTFEQSKTKILGLLTQNSSQITQPTQPPPQDIQEPTQPLVAPTSTPQLFPSPTPIPAIPTEPPVYNTQPTPTLTPTPTITETVLVQARQDSSQLVNISDPNVELNLTNTNEQLVIIATNTSTSTQTTNQTTTQTTTSTSQPTYRDLITVSQTTTSNQTNISPTPIVSNNTASDPNARLLDTNSTDSQIVTVIDDIYVEDSPNIFDFGTNDQSSSTEDKNIIQQTTDSILSLFGIGESTNVTSSPIAQTSNQNQLQGVELVDESEIIVNSILNAHKLQVAAVGEQSVSIKRAEVAAITTLPVKLSVNNVSFKVETSAGERQVTYFADSIVDTLQIQHFIDNVKPTTNVKLSDSAQTDKLIKLSELNGELVYEIIGETRQYLFLIIPINVNRGYIVSAEVKQIRGFQQSTKDRILDMLSLEI